jgi:hypothetical protein
LLWSTESCAQCQFPDERKPDKPGTGTEDVDTDPQLTIWILPVQGTTGPEPSEQLV